MDINGINGDLSMDATEFVYPSVEFQFPGQIASEAFCDLSGSEPRRIAVSLDPPMSFLDRHSFLDGVYDSHPNPEHISARDIVSIARRAGLCMEETHTWFEDESRRRSKLLAKFQGHLTTQLGPCSPESISSYAASQRTSATTGGSESLQPGPNFYPPAQSILSGPSSPGTISGDHLQIPSRVRRGRPPRSESSSPPQPKRQKSNCQYPCVDCGKAFPATGWSEHVKRVHFPDYIWECPKTTCEWKHFYRLDNFSTHLLREHRCDNSEITQLKATCKFAVVGFFHKICGICSIDLGSRDESIKHIRAHLREISCRKDPPNDLGLSEWKEQCTSKHTLQRGVHYQLVKGKLPEDTHVNSLNDKRDPDCDGSHGYERDNSNNNDWSPSYQGGDEESPGGAGGGFYSTQYFSTYRIDDDLADPTAFKPSSSSYTMNYLHSPYLAPSPSHLTCPYLPPPQSYRHRSCESIFSSDEAEEKARCTYPECGKVFKDLKAHMLTHQNERPEKCPIPTCDYHVKGFARKYDKNRHTLTHYRGTLVCGFCPGSGSAAEKSFNRADVFKRHLTSVHAVEQTPPNSRKKSTVAQASSGVQRFARYAPDATGKCSTCTAIFSNAQDFYEHLDDCVLRIVQQEEPVEAINASRLAEVETDPAVHQTLRNNTLPMPTPTLQTFDEYG